MRSTERTPSMAATSRIMSSVWARVSKGVASVRASMVRRAGGPGAGRVVAGAAGEAPGDVEDDAGDDDGRDGVGQFELGDLVALADKAGGEADEDCDGGPDVGAEVDGIGFEGFASGFGGDAVELAGAGVVDGGGEEEGEEGPDGEFECEMFSMSDAV